MTYGLIVSLLFVSTLGACFERDLKVSVDGKIPPTFNLSGSGNLNFFVVMEVPPQNQTQKVQRSSDNNIVLWKIAPRNIENSIRKLSPITYGRLPVGFAQLVPSNGEPTALIEGKIYEVGGTAYNSNGGFIWITVRDGKIFRVPMPDE
jgi:hypothetical protein